MRAQVSQATRREEERVQTGLKVVLDEGIGVTRDVSASGVYFSTDTDYAAGSEISFAIELDAPRGKMMLKCLGEIVRVERREGKIGVAAKFTNCVFEQAEAA